MRAAGTSVHSSSRSEYERGRDNHRAFRENETRLPALLPSSTADRRPDRQDSWGTMVPYPARAHYGSYSLTQGRHEPRRPDERNSRAPRTYELVNGFRDSSSVMSAAYGSSGRRVPFEAYEEERSGLMRHTSPSHESARHARPSDEPFYADTGVGSSTRSHVSGHSGERRRRGGPDSYESYDSYPSGSRGESSFLLHSIRKQAHANSKTKCPSVWAPLYRKVARRS